MEATNVIKCVTVHEAYTSNVYSFHCSPTTYIQASFVLPEPETRHKLIKYGYICTICCKLYLGCYYQRWSLKSILRNIKAFSLKLAVEVLTSSCSVSVMMISSYTCCQQGGWSINLTLLKNSTPFLVLCCIVTYYEQVNYYTITRTLIKSLLCEQSK